MIKAFWDRRPKKIFKGLIKAIPFSLGLVLVLVLVLSALVSGVSNWNLTTLIQAVVGLLVLLVLATLLWGIWHGMMRWAFDKMTPKVNVMNWALAGLSGAVGLWIFTQALPMPFLILGLWVLTILSLGLSHTYWAYPPYQVKIRTKMIDVEDEET